MVITNAVCHPLQALDCRANGSALLLRKKALPFTLKVRPRVEEWGVEESGRQEGTRVALEGLMLLAVEHCAMPLPQRNLVHDPLSVCVFSMQKNMTDHLAGVCACAYALRVCSQGCVFVCA